MQPSAHVRIDARRSPPTASSTAGPCPPDADALAHAAYEPPQGEIETARRHLVRAGVDDQPKRQLLRSADTLLAVRLLSRIREIDSR